MAEGQQPATPPAASGGDENVIAGLTAQIAAMQATLEQLGANQKVLGDTIQAMPKPISLDDVKKVVADDAAAARQQIEAARADADKAAAKGKARQAVVDGKLKGVPEEFLAKLPDTDDAAELDKAADAIVARWNEVGKTKPADLPAAGADGGTVPGAREPAAVGSNLPDGLAKLAAEVKLPK